MYMQLTPVEHALHAEIGRLQGELNEQKSANAKLDKRVVYLEKKMQDLWLQPQTTIRREEIETAKRLAARKAERLNR